MIGIPQIANALVAFLAPYLPHLFNLGKEASKAVFEGAAKKGGEETWNKAKSLWDKIRSHFADAPAIEGAAAAVASEPDEVVYRAGLVKALTGLLQTHPELAKELVKLMGGEESVQTVLIDNWSTGEGIHQILEGAGKQTVEIREGSTGKNIVQRKK